jgi:hypothetical protein
MAITPKRSTVYSPDVLTCTFAGINIAQGLGKGGFLKITQPDPNWTYTPGIGGEGVFNHKATRQIEVEVTLLQTSEANALLSAYHIASEAADGLPGIFYFEDRKGTSKIASPDAVLEKLPDESYGEEADDVTWKIIVHAPQRFVGSH